MVCGSGWKLNWLPMVGFSSIILMQQCFYSNPKWEDLENFQGMNNPACQDGGASLLQGHRNSRNRDFSLCIFLSRWIFWNIPHDDNKEAFLQLLWATLTMTKSEDGVMETLDGYLIRQTQQSWDWYLVGPSFYSVWPDDGFMGILLELS